MDNYMTAYNFLTLTSDTQVPAHLHPNHHDDPLSTHEPEVHLYSHGFRIPEIPTKPRSKDLRAEVPAAVAVVTSSASSASSDSGGSANESLSDLSITENTEQAAANVDRQAVAKGKQRATKERGAGEKKPRLAKLGSITKRLSLW